MEQDDSLERSHEPNQSFRLRVTDLTVVITRGSQFLILVAAFLCTSVASQTAYSGELRTLKRALKESGKEDAIKVEVELAKQGNSAAQEKILCDVRFATDPEVRHGGLDALSRTGGWFAIRNLRQFLSDSPANVQITAPKNKGSDVRFLGRRYYAIKYLGEILPNAPLRPSEGELLNKPEHWATQWNQWIEEHENSLSQLEPHGVKQVASKQECRNTLVNISITSDTRVEDQNSGWGGDSYFRSTGGEDTVLPTRFPIVSLLAVCLLNSVTLAQAAAQQSTANRELIRRIQNGTDAQAELEAGSSGNTDFVPFLRERLRHDVDKNNSLKPQARMALAKLGDTQEQQALFCRVAAGNMNEMQFALSHELPYVGGWYSIQIFDRVIRSELATNPRPVALPPDLSIAHAQVYAREAVHKIFPDIPVQNGPAIPSAQQWSEYFNTHKAELTKLQPTGEGVKFSTDACKGGKVRKK